MNSSNQGYDPIGYGTLLNAIFKKESGRYRYRYVPHMSSRSGDLLVLHVFCERWWREARLWQEVHQWKDLYRRCPDGYVAYQGVRYALDRTLDPWHESTAESTMWPDWIVESRKQDKALMATLRKIRQTADTPKLQMRGRTR